MKKKIIPAYLFIALLFGLYGWLFGQSSYRGFFYNLGRGIVWPTILFPALGQIISGIVWLIVIVAILVFVRNKNT